MARVLLVGKGPPDRGGIAAFLQALTSSNLGDRHELHLLNLAHEEEREGGRATIGNVRRTLSDALALWRAGRDYDVVHLHSALNPLVTVLRAGGLALVARLRGARVIVHAHGGKVCDWMSDGWRRSAVRISLTPANRVVAVSSDVHAALSAALGPRRVLTIANGVDLSAFSPGTAIHTPLRILYVGLLTPRKGVLDLIRASELLCERDVAHELWLVGGTPDEGGTGEAEVRAAAQGRATLLGHRAHEVMPAIYRDADVFCLPSWWEGMPLSVLEAMAAGLPIVATRVGEVPHVLEDGVSGLLVEPRDPEGLASALETVLCDAGRRRTLAAAARKRAETHFSLAATVDALDRLYDEVHGL